MDNSTKRDPTKFWHLHLDFFRAQKFQTLISLVFEIIGISKGLFKSGEKPAFYFFLLHTFSNSVIKAAKGHGKKMRTSAHWVSPERFKTRAAHFPIQRDEKTGMQRAILDKSGSEAAL